MGIRDLREMEDRKRWAKAQAKQFMDGIRERKLTMAETEGVLAERLAELEVEVTRREREDLRAKWVDAVKKSHAAYVISLGPILEKEGPR